MAIANLQETINTTIYEKARLLQQMQEYQTQKSLALFSQQDVQAMLTSEKQQVRKYFKNLYEDDPTLQETYVDYTEIPDFEDEIDKITAKFQEQLDELISWEVQCDNEITTASAQLEELKSFEQTWKTYLSSNISDDNNFGLN